MPVAHRIKTKLSKKLAPFLLPIESIIPKTLEGEGCVSQIATVCKLYDIKKPLVVTDKDLLKLGLVDQITDVLDKDPDVDYVVFSDVFPDPTEALIFSGGKAYMENHCDGLIAFGGGSAMDTAKVIGAYSMDPGPVSKFQGYFQISKGCPPIIAIPTTAGTGSETTPAAVVKNPEKKQKYAVVDKSIMPVVAILDPAITRGLPGSITAATGMDALTHAVESYTNTFRFDGILPRAKSAVKAVFDDLYTCYEDGNDMRARQSLLRAAFEAGVSFSLGAVGYVHAIAHTVGANFGTPHGVANAMILPFVLEAFGDAVHTTLAELSIHVGFGTADESEKVLAEKFITEVRKLHAKMNMPTTIRGMKKSDIPFIAKTALAEAHGETHSIFSAPALYLTDGGYPVPKYFSQKEVEGILELLLEPTSKL